MKTMSEKEKSPKKSAREEELTNDLKRLQAEFENYRKRIERDRELEKTQAKKEIILKLLGVLDNFELALKAGQTGEFAKGIELIYAQLLSALESEGLKVIPTKKFDPQYHEALLMEENEKENGTILEVLQKGYTLKGIVIRHAKVKLSK